MRASENLLSERLCAILLLLLAFSEREVDRPVTNRCVRMPIATSVNGCCEALLVVTSSDRSSRAGHLLRRDQ